MTQNSVLDTAGRISMSLRPLRDQSSPRAGVVITHDRDATRSHVRTFDLTWAPAMLPQVKNIRAHFAANPGAFVLNHPGGTAYDVVYESAPQVSPKTGNSANVTVTLIEAVATD